MFGWPQIDSSGFAAKRRALFADLMKAHALDHAVLSGFDNVRWATDIRTSLTYDSNYDWYCAVVDSSGDVTMITNDGGSEDDRPVAQVPWLRRRVAGPSWQSHWAHPAAFVRVAADALRKGRARRVGVEVLNFEIMDALRQALPDIVFVPILRHLLELRKIKLPEEIILIEASCKVASQAMWAGISGAREGMRDTDIAALAASEVYRNGAEQLSHAVVVKQARAGSETWFASGSPLGNGQAFFMDMGCYGVGGYCSDFCRVGFLGEPPRAVRMAYSDLSHILDSTAAGLKPGVRCSDIRRMINDALKMKGLPETPYAMGHGIGARLIEYPSMFVPDLMDHDDVLQEGMVICIEPSTHLELDGEVVRLKDENQYVVEANGLRTLTLCPRVIG